MNNNTFASAHNKSEPSINKRAIVSTDEYNKALRVVEKLNDKACNLDAVNNGLIVINSELREKNKKMEDEITLYKTHCLDCSRCDHQCEVTNNKREEL